MPKLKAMTILLNVDVTSIVLVEPQWDENFAQPVIVYIYKKKQKLLNRW